MRSKQIGNVGAARLTSPFDVRNEDTIAMTLQHLRIARATNRLREMVAFYRFMFDFKIIGEFTDHDGFDGVMLGHPHHGFHIEFTHERDGSNEAPTSPENVIVLYFDVDAWNEVGRRRESHDIPAVRAHNPYWDRHGTTIADPDGHLIVLHNGPWKPECR